MTSKFTWYSTYDATAGDPVLFLRNTVGDDKILSITNLFFGSLANNRFHVFRVTGLAGGTETQGQNRSGLAANQNPGSDGKSFGNAAVTGLTQTTRFAPTVRVAANRSEERRHNPLDLILKDTQAMAIYAAVSGEMEVAIMGEYA